MTTFSSIAHTLARCTAHSIQKQIQEAPCSIKLLWPVGETKHFELLLNVNSLPLATGFALVFFFKPLKSTPLVDLSRTRPLRSYWPATSRESRCAHRWLARSTVDQHQPLKTSVAKRSCDAVRRLVDSTNAVGIIQVKVIIQVTGKAEVVIISDLLRSFDWYKCGKLCMNDKNK